MRIRRWCMILQFFDIAPRYYLLMWRKILVARHDDMLFAAFILNFQISMLVYNNLTTVENSQNNQHFIHIHSLAAEALEFSRLNICSKFQAQQNNFNLLRYSPICYLN